MTPGSLRKSFFAEHSGPRFAPLPRNGPSFYLSVKIPKAQAASEARRPVASEVASTERSLITVSMVLCLAVPNDIRHHPS